MKKLWKTAAAIALLLLISACDSPLQEAVIRDLKLPPPHIDLASGLYTQEQEITISSDDSEADIRYVLRRGGSVIADRIYSNPIIIEGDNENFELEAFLTKPLALDSDRVTRTYELNYDALPAPTITYAPDVVTVPGVNPRNIQVFVEPAPEKGGDIEVYIPQHPVYGGNYHSYTPGTPILLNEDEKTYSVNAKAVSSGLPPSQPVTARFTISYPLITAPILDPLPGDRNRNSFEGYVEVTHPVEGAVMSYKLMEAGHQLPENWTALPVNNRIPFPSIESDSTYSLLLQVSAENYKTLVQPVTYTFSSGTCDPPEMEINIPDPGTLSEQQISDYVIMETAQNIFDVYRDLNFTLSTPMGEEEIFYTRLDDSGSTWPGIPLLKLNSAGTEFEPFTHPAITNPAQHYTGSISIARESAARTVRICAVSAEPGKNMSDPVYFEINLDHYTLAQPQIQYTGSNPTNAPSVNWSIGYDSTNPARHVGITTQYSLDGGDSWTEYDGTTPSLVNQVNKEDLKEIRVQTTTSDSQLLDSAIAAYNLDMDRVPPVPPSITLSSDFSSYNGTRYLYTGDLTPYVSWTTGGSSDSTGTYQWSIGGFTGSGNSTNVQGSSLNDNTSYSISVSEYDDAGNQATSSASFFVDKNRPTLVAYNIYPRKNGIYINFTSSSDTNGLADASLTGSGTHSIGSSSINVAGLINRTNYSFSLSLTDKAGNEMISPVNLSCLAGVSLVSNNGTGTGNSWDNPASLGSALINSRTYGIPEIWMKQGKYTTSGSYVLDLNNQENITITGSFLGANEAYSDKRTVGNSPTILSGEGSKRGIYSTSENTGVIVKNLIVKNGDALNGGGAYLNSSHAVFEEVVFKDNNATSGGAVYITSSTTSGIKNRNTFRNCVFMNNFATNGGAIYQRSFDLEPEPAVEASYVESCTFSDNSTTGGTNSHGGHIYLVQGNMYCYNTYFDSDSVTTTTSDGSGGGWTAYVADAGYLSLLYCGTKFDLTTAAQPSSNNGYLSNGEVRDTTASTADSFAGIKVVDTLSYTEDAGLDNEIVLNGYWAEADGYSRVYIENCVGYFAGITYYTVDGDTFNGPENIANNDLIDGGSNDYSNSTYDLFGYPRIKDGADPDTVSTIDIGAVEY